LKLEFNIDEESVPWPVGMSFVGQYAGTNFYCFDIMSRIFKDYPDVKSIVELGTFYGTMTMYLGLWGLRLGIPVHTFDIEPNNSAPVHHVLETLGVQMHWVDVFTEEGIREVLDAIGPEPGYMFCDGGDKQREFETFAPVVPTGQVMSVHDWGTEVKSLDGGILRLNYHPEDWTRRDSMLATVIKLGDGAKALENATDAELADIRRKWIEVLGEKTRA